MFVALEAFEFWGMSALHGTLGPAAVAGDADADFRNIFMRRVGGYLGILFAGNGIEESQDREDEYDKYNIAFHEINYSPGS